MSLCEEKKRGTSHILVSDFRKYQRLRLSEGGGSLDAPVAHGASVRSEGCAASDGLISLARIDARVLLSVSMCGGRTVEHRVERAQLTPHFDQDVVGAVRACACTDETAHECSDATTTRAAVLGGALRTGRMLCTLDSTVASATKNLVRRLTADNGTTGDHQRFPRLPGDEQESTEPPARASAPSCDAPNDPKSPTLLLHIRDVAHASQSDIQEGRGAHIRN